MKNKKMKRILCIIIGFLVSVTIYAQDYSKTDSILINQIKAANGICEIKKLTKEISKLGENLSEGDSIVLNNIIYNINEISNVNEDYDSITNKIIGIAGEAPKEKSRVDIWDFISGALAEMTGAFIGAGAALWIFFSQTKREKENEKQAEQKELNEKNHYLGSLLKVSINLAQKQNDGIKEFYEKLDANPLYIPLIPIHPKQDLERLSKLIDNEEYYHAFLNKYGSEIANVKKYRGIAGSIDFLNSQINQMFDMQSKGQKFDHERKMKYKALFDRARDCSAELGMRNIESNPDLHTSIGDILQKYYDGLTNSFELEYHQQNLVDPLKEMLLDKFRDLPEVRQITNDLKNATLIYSEIKAQNKNHSEGFKGFYKYIEQAVKALEENGKELIAEFKEEKNTAANRVE